jgi:hypothetical protein
MANHERQLEHILPGPHSETATTVAHIAAQAYEPHLADASIKPRPATESSKEHNFFLDLGRAIFGVHDSQPVKHDSTPVKHDSATVKHPPSISQHERFFAGGAKSWVYRCVGAAEGNLKPNGQVNRESYNGHRDLNGQWNRGAFSNQRDKVATAAEADKLQLERLSKHDKTISSLAKKYGLTLTVEERMNALDLANQAEAAVLNGWGFIERLNLAKKREGLTGREAILYARKWAFFDPSERSGRGAWESAVFGNNPKVIETDQRRRMLAIADTIELLKKGK